MGLNCIKRLLFLFCLFNLVLNENSYTLKPHETTTISGKGEDTFSIGLSQGSFNGYFKLIFSLTTSEDKRNPSIIISTDKDSKKRIYTSVQLYDKIYIFLKREQINNQFYIRVQNRENSAVQDYKIEIIDEDKAYLPFNQQTSYYISEDESNKEMEFVFQKDNSGSTDISFWAQGKSILSATTTISSFQSQKYLSSYTINVFYGSIPTNNFDFKVTSSKGDYITVGSVTMSGSSVFNELKENRNEIIVASKQNEVCFPITYSNKIMHITGKIFTFKAKGIFKDSDDKPIVEDDVHLESDFTNGILSELNAVGFISETYKNENGAYCLQSSGLKIFSIQMTCNIGETELVSPPLLPGDIRSHFIERGQIAIFYGTKPRGNTKEINFNLKSLTGFPEMYYTECTTFPNCHYTIDQIKDFEHPYPSNRITVYSSYMKDMTDQNFNPITENQPLMIVYCAEGGKQGIFEESSFCSFETTIFTSDDDIILLPESTFSQYLLSGEIDNYQVNFPEVTQDKTKIYLDLMLFSGDVDLNYIKDVGVDANKYYLSNKIFYSIHLKKGMKQINFKVIGNSNAFYMVQYQIINSNDESDDENTIESGVNYITTKNVDETNNFKKILNLINFKIEFGQPYLVTFYSPNCKFSVFWDSNPNIEPTKISYLDNYGYIIISSDNPYYNQDKYKFHYVIESKDVSEFPKKFCAVNVAGLELSNSTNEWNGRSISLSEGVPHTYVFSNNYPLIYYSYHASNTNNTLILNFNLIDKAYFNVTIKINRKNPSTSTIYRNTQLYVTKDDFDKNCEQDEVCTVDVEVLMWNSTRDRKVETTMYQLDGLPFYLEKNVLRDDIVNGNIPKHYYFDIGSGEYGDITLDFKRGSGFIYASVEPRIKSEKPKDADWRGLYKFPTSTIDTLKYRTYGKKIMIDSKSTEICTGIGGCYVLITIESNMYNQNAETPFRISIIPRIMKTDESIPSPKVRINVNEFIIGDILKGQADNRKYDYYTVTLPYDSDYILIDWQADNPTLVIKVGPDRPTKDDYHFDFPAIDHDTVHRINRSAIIDKIIYDDDAHDSLRGVELTIGIYSETSDSLQSSPYAFKLFMPPIIDKTDEGNVISAEVIHIRSDQKVQCLPFEYDPGIYMCLFAVIFDDNDIMNNLIAYPRSQDGKPINIYGDLVKAEYIETNDMVQLIYILTTIFRDEHKKNQKYIYIENVQKYESYFLIVTTDDPSTVIEVLSSTYNIEDGMTFYPNPSTPQILALKNNKIEIEIFTSQELLINLGSVDGTGAICWKDKCDDKTKIYYLNDLGDKLSLTNYRDEQNKLYLPLKVEPLVNLDDKPGGFIFYITYYPRSYIDQVKRDSTTEIQYSTVKMPLDYYVPVKLIYPNTINFNIYNMDTKNNDDLVYDSDLFDVWGTLISNTEAVQIRVDPRYRPNINDQSINITRGVFDIIFGTLYFSEEDMNGFHPKEGEGNIPNIFFSLEPKSNLDNTFTSFGLELDISSMEKELGSETAPEGVYLTGNLANTMFGRKIYRLKLDPNKIFLIVEYSSNSYFIDFALSSNLFSEENDHFDKFNITEEYGKKVMIVEFNEEYFSKNNDSLYFIVFTKYLSEDPKLQYFVLKYINSQNYEDITQYMKPFNNTLDVTKDNNNYKISFEPYLYDTGVTYYIKAVYKSGVNFEENINSIAISETKGINVQITNPKKVDGNIVYNLEVKEEISYIKVLARFNFLYGKYIHLYTPYETEITEIQYSNGLTKSFSAAKKARYELTFGSQTLNNYIKVVVSNYKENQIPVLYFSGTDSKCIENRYQLAKGGEMWIKREQFQNAHFYLVVECPQINCNYDLTFSESDTVIFESLRVFNYFVHSDNTEMVFKFKNELKSNRERMTLYATGGKYIKITLKNCDGQNCNQFNFTEGAAITTTTNGDEYFILTVTAQNGDYISVGVKTIDPEGKSIVNNLSIETGQISGFLKRNLLEKECYLLPTEDDTYYISGTLYNSFAMIALVNSDLNIEDKDSNYFRGFFSLVYDRSTEKNYEYLCIKMAGTNYYNSDDSFSYSIQLQSKSNFNGNNYPSQYPGGIYSRIIPTGKLAFFNYIYPHVASEYTVYNMITTKGYPKMYVYECFTYPFCEIDYDSLENNRDVKRISDINRMSTYFIETKKTAFPIDAHQYLLVVKCTNPTVPDNDYDHCEFMTSIFGEKEEVVLVEKQPFGQYMIQNDTDQFLIDFSKERQDNMKIHIDFYVVSGDVSFELKDKDTGKVLEDMHKYYLANKIFYSLTIDKKSNRNVNLNRIRIQTTAKVNSYYIVEYKLIKDSLQEDTNTIFSGINYLIPISQNSTEEKSKSIIIKSVKIIRPKAYIDTFYSLNCKINVKKFSADGTESQLSSFGDFAQEFHKLEDESDKMNEERSYNISISKDGVYVLNDKDMCMIYVSGFEIYEPGSGIRKEILLSEGVPHLVHFDPDLAIMRYVYPHADPRKDLTVSLNMIVPGQFTVNYFFREKEYNTESVVSQSTILFVPKDVIQTGCQEEDELCSITVQIECTKLFNSVEPQIELTIKQIKNTPYYVPRGIIRKDYISGEAFLFLYTDVGQDEGYVTVNFERESGFVYGKVVQIYQADPDVNADWRNYRFIRNKNEDGSLYYDFYNKKLLFNKTSTEKCGDGCYILISIKTSVYKDNIQDSEYQYFTLLADFSPKNYIEKPKIPKRIQLVPEEYIIGSLFKDDKIEGKDLYDYYTFQIPYDIQSLEIDWQSDTAILLINIGTRRPSNMSTPDFNRTERRDTNIIISRQDIIKKIDGVDDQSLQGVDITFGIYTNYYDSLGSTPYAFRVHLPKKELNIYKITSDQKTICRPQYLDNEGQYRCLFMITYQEFQLFNDLIIYAKSQNPSAIVNMFGNFIDVNIYNSFDVVKLKEQIPKDNDNSKFNTKKDSTRFIFLSYSNSESNAYISVIADQQGDIELYTSFKTFEDRLSPNPSTAQVYSMDLLKRNISLDFITTKSFAVNIMSLYGEARISLEKDPQGIFYLRGAEDSLDYVIKGKEGETLLTVENLRYGLTEAKNPGFAFMLDFNLRNLDVELDLMKIDETTEIAYKQADFPVYYYVKIFDKDNDINGFFYLHNVIYDSSEIGERKIVPNELAIRATVMEENTILEIKEDPTKLSSHLNDLTIKGTYDSFLQAGNIRIPKDVISQKSKPTLFMVIEKGDDGKKVKYNRIRGEIGFSTINGNSPITQKLYQFNKLENKDTVISYKLTVDTKNSNFIRVQFSANSDYVSFSLSKEKGSKTNGFSNIDQSVGRGIKFATLERTTNLEYFYLNVFWNGTQTDTKLGNYVFKYINSNNRDGFFEFKILGNNDTIELEKDSDSSQKLKVKFYPIDFTYDPSSDIDTNIIYTIKYVKKEELVPNENVNTIAMTESKGIAKIFKHVDSNQIETELTDVSGDIGYVQVIATITQGSIIEYVAYSSTNKVTIKQKSNDENKPESTDGEKNGDNAGLYVIIGVSAFLLVVVVVLIIVIVRYNSKNKDLLSQVNKISFVQSGATENNKDDANLLLDNQNELD